MILKPQDVVVALKLLGYDSRRPPFAQIARELALSSSEVHAAMKRAQVCATKIEAFRGRGNGGYLASHDLEDLITLVDGRPELLSELRSAPTDVRSYIAAAIGQMLTTDEFMNAPARLLIARCS